MIFKITFLENVQTIVKKIICDSVCIENGVLVCLKNNQIVAAFNTWLTVLPEEE